MSTPLEKKKQKLSSLRHEAFYATRNGNLRKAQALSKSAELLEDEIVEMINDFKS
ncbi:MAG: hypothetical protein H8E12_08925 [Rhodobacteraceae bacterium]|nr:hypothetical protein [Paracoccaceae bacterium]